MKKQLIALFAAGILVAGLTACNDDGGHKHAYGDWIEATPSTCVNHGVVGHYHCDGCNKDFDGEHNELTSLEAPLVNHTFTEEKAESKYLSTPANCTEAATYFKSCSVCGAAGTDTFTYGNPAGHTYNRDEWKWDNDTHWHAASCEHKGEKADEEAHDMVTSQDGTVKKCSKCDYEIDLITSLATPAGLKYENRAIAFTAVQYAQKYEVVILSGQTEVMKEEVTETSLSVTTLAAGAYTAKVTAIYKAVKSEEATLGFTVLSVDGDVIIEAEDAVLNTKHISHDAVAHGGKYALGFDDCGQGLYFRYYAVEAGEKAVDVIYSTGSANSYMNLYLNGAFSNKVIFAENTGWFGDTKTSATATVNVNFAQGWNEIYLIKDGNDQDNPSYGGWAQIDYIKIHGSGKEYDASLLDTSSNVYKLEAECAEWHWKNADTRPTHWVNEGFSLGYGLGSMDNEGDGVKFTFKVAETGTYKIQLAYGGGGDTPIKVSINGGEAQTITLTGATSWDSKTLDGSGLTATFTAGETCTVDFMQAGTWYVPDYLLITRVTE